MMVRVSPRATALPPQQRRAALVDCALHLIRAHGAVPSTKEIAEAAGVAEGTIFRAFETKDELLAAATASAFCPAPIRREVARIDPALPLRERLVALVTVLQHRFIDVFGLMIALGLSAPPVEAVRDHDDCTPERGHVPAAGADCAAAHAAHARVPPEGRGHAHREIDRSFATQIIVGLIAPDADQITCTPAELATYLRLLTFSGSHRQITDGVLLSPETIVGILLDGVLVAEGGPTAAEPAVGTPRRNGIPARRPTRATRSRKAV